MSDEEEDRRDELDAEEASRGAIIARNRCQDRMCGALDCYTCRGPAALDELFPEEPDL